MSLSDLKQVLKKNNFLFNTHMILSDKTYILNFIDYFRQRHVKPGRVVWSEVSQFCKYWHSEPFTYFKYRIYEKNVSPEELLDYIPAYFFYNVYIPSVYVNKAIYDIGNSKIKQSSFLFSRNIPVPREIGSIIDGIPYNKSKRKLSFRELINEMNGFDCQSVFIKPDLGKGGKGIHRLEKRHGMLYIKNKIVDEKVMTSIAGKRSFLIQEGATQRQDFNDIYPGSVNTVRFVTQSINSHVEIVAVVLRMGQNGNYVDNVSSGGLGMMINIQTGALDSYASDIDFKDFYKHPGTGFKFEGYRIPGWDSIVREIITFSLKAPEFPNIAWDTAVTDSGIKVLEFNINYGFDGIQSCIGGLRRKMSVAPA